MNQRLVAITQVGDQAKWVDVRLIGSRFDRRVGIGLAIAAHPDVRDPTGSVVNRRAEKIDRLGTTHQPAQIFDDDEVRFTVHQNASGYPRLAHRKCYRRCGL